MTDFIQLVANDLRQQPRKVGKDYFFKCPFHSGGNEKTGSLKVTNGDNAHNPGYYCFGCNEHGGVVGYYLKRGYSLEEARRMAGAPAHPSAYQAREQEYAPPAAPAGEAWQERARSLITYAQGAFHAAQVKDTWPVTDLETGEKNAQNITALEWFLSRGLYEDTARAWSIGYNPSDVYDLRERWGLPPDPEKPKIWIPRGLVIPHIDSGGRVWSIKIRRANGKPKYIHVTGSQADLYMAQTITDSAPIILTEGEIDALTLWQEASDLAGIATLGSASNAKGFSPAPWGIYFLCSPRRYTVFDLDAAGDSGAEALKEYQFAPLALPKARPWNKDVNDYYRCTGRLREWIQDALERQP